MKCSELCRRVLKRITPSESERKRELALAKGIIAGIGATEGQHTRVVLAGSLARDTHLRGDRDIDIFVLFPEKLTRAEFEREGLRIAKRVFRGHEWEKAYSEHPYIRGVINGFEVEVVPSYSVEKAELLKSAVDRSPFHAEYVKRMLKESQKSEVRLLKQFLKGIGCYGADIRASSVPGYVVELLILKYGDFMKAIDGIAEWGRNETIDIEGHYSAGEALKKFDSCLVVVDPVDRNRNVAAALSCTQYSRMIAAARTFLKKPGSAFFFGRKRKPLGVENVRKLLAKKELIAVEIGYPKGALSDIAWGQLRRLRKKLGSELERAGFELLRSDDWTDERNSMVALFELGSLTLQKTMKRVGPEVANREHSERFLASHRRLIAGPRIENGRWVIEIERKYHDARRLLADFLRKEKRVEKALIKKAMNKRCNVLSEEKIIGLYKRNAEFRDFLSRYLRGKEEFGE